MKLLLKNISAIPKIKGVHLFFNFFTTNRVKFQDSSRNWINKHINDEYVKRSRYENFRARSAFKLIQIDEKHDILRPGEVIIDLGASPGSWSQVATRILKLNNEVIKTRPKHADKAIIKKGLVISVDLLPIAPIKGAITLGNLDFTKSLNQSRLIQILNGRTVDLIMSDMAPNASGVQELDHESITSLNLAALQFAVQFLTIGKGRFLAKFWNGKNIQPFKENYLDKLFKQTYIVKPPASKDHSSELYLLAKGFLGLKKM